MYTYLDAYYTKGIYKRVCETRIAVAQIQNIDVDLPTLGSDDVPLVRGVRLGVPKRDT